MGSNEKVKSYTLTKFLSLKISRDTDFHKNMNIHLRSCHTVTVQLKCSQLLILHVCDALARLQHVEAVRVTNADHQMTGVALLRLVPPHLGVGNRFDDP